MAPRWPYDADDYDDSGDGNDKVIYLYKRKQANDHRYTHVNNT